MTHGCKVHGNTSECVSSQLEKLKIAVALVVIRNKPADQNVKDFVHNLVFFQQDREQKWKAEYHRLKQEVLQLRQQQLLFSINTRLDSQSSGKTQDFRSRPDHLHSQPVLTPPDSQSDSQRNTTLALPRLAIASPQNDEADVDHMTFLRAYFYLDHQLRLNRPPPAQTGLNNEILEKDVIRQSVLSVLQHVDTNTSNEQSDFLRYLDSFRVCVRLLDSHGKWSQSMRDKFIELSSSWLKRIIQGDSVFRYNALLNIIADSDGMSLVLTDILVKAIAESQERMNEWVWDGVELMSQAVLTQFSASSYYFLLLEKTLPRVGSSDRSRFRIVLSHVEQRVHVNFPLFSASMMRLAHQLNS